MRNRGLMLFVPLLLCFASGGPANALPKGDKGREIQVRRVFKSYLRAWDLANAGTMATMYTADGDLVIPTGQVMKGRSAIGRFYGAVFERGYRGSTGTAQIFQLRFVRNDVAIVDGTWGIRGAHHADGQARKPEAGVFTAVLLQKGGEWRITALREQSSATWLEIPAEK